jgi:transglutaminase-like putative cysteine protease
MSRRFLLASGCAAVAAAALPVRSSAQERRFAPAVGGWRSFEVTTVVSVPQARGTTRVWLPVPDVDTTWQKSMDNSWTGNASTVQVVSDPTRGVRMVMAEFAPTAGAPTLALTSRVQTRSRAIDWNDPRPVREDPAQLRADLAPSELLPTDGIVRDTALEITRGARTDVDKVRAIYDWLVANGYREPKVRGCGLGDIKDDARDGQPGRQVRRPERGVRRLCARVGHPGAGRVRPARRTSAFGYKELGANPANLKGAQHCRAEVFLRQHGWVAMDRPTC